MTNQKIPVIIENRADYEKLRDGLHKAHNTLAENGIEVPRELLNAETHATETILRYRKYNILSSVETLSDPGRRIVENFKSAVADGKINIKDFDEGWNIIKAIAEIAKKAPEIAAEIVDLDWPEIKILAVCILDEAEKAV